MNKIAQGLIGATAAILLLAGCSAVSAEAQGVASATPSATPAPVLSAAPTANPVEDEFYTATKRIPGLENVSRADALTVGHYVCNQLDAGVSPLDITAIKNTDRVNNDDMISVSTLTLCKGESAAVQQAFAARDKAERIAKGSDR